MPRSLPRKNPENFAAHWLLIGGLIGGLKIHGQYAFKSHYYWLFGVFCRFGKSACAEIFYT